MAQEEKVRAALALLRQAGRMDLIRDEAAAVLACSPPRAGAACDQVRRGGRPEAGVCGLGGTGAGREEERRRPRLKGFPGGGGALVCR
ncbi:hypothetical protein NDU88_005205 [Pleurodeles waltl]|uniref:Uncharacterized protein n=1 Tax=Pleurodeles waltl TaxID=8319 RepID=A0AAV7W8Y5_PLEWA|nr:hypothetical protein NDU88_005205 [Pleurodeles waltl]